MDVYINGSLWDLFKRGDYMKAEKVKPVSFSTIKKNQVLEGFFKKEGTEEKKSS
jgi:hypothetical protein